MVRKIFGPVKENATYDLSIRKNKKLESFYQMSSLVGAINNKRLDTLGESKIYSPYSIREEFNNKMIR